MPAEPSPIVPGSGVTYRELQPVSDLRWFEIYMAGLAKYRQAIASSPCHCCRCADDREKD